MLDDIEISELIPHIIIYVIVTIMMWFVFGYWAKTTEAIRINIFTRILFQIVLIPLAYVITEHYRNKG